MGVGVSPGSHLTFMIPGSQKEGRRRIADLVILDLESHGLGGLLLTSAVQELAPGLRIVAVSLRAEVDTRPLMQRGVPYVRLGVDGDAGGRAILAELAGRSGAALGAGSR